MTSYVKSEEARIISSKPLTRAILGTVQTMMIVAHSWTGSTPWWIVRAGSKQFRQTACPCRPWLWSGFATAAACLPRLCGWHGLLLAPRCSSQLPLLGLVYRCAQD